EGISSAWIPETSLPSCRTGLSAVMVRKDFPSSSFVGGGVAISLSAPGLAEPSCAMPAACDCMVSFEGSGHDVACSEGSTSQTYPPPSKIPTAKMNKMKEERMRVLHGLRKSPAGYRRRSQGLLGHVGIEHPNLCTRKPCQAGTLPLLQAGGAGKRRRAGGGRPRLYREDQPPLVSELPYYRHVSSRLLAERAANEEEQFSRLADHVIDEVGQRECREKDHHDAN